MSRVVMVALVLGCFAAAKPGLHAQSQSDQPQDSSQNMPAPASKPGNAAPKADNESNPFPTDTNTVPVLPSASSPGTPVPDEHVPAYSNVPLPGDIADPVRSPDDPVASPSESSSSGSSSSDSSDLDQLLKPPPDTGKHKGDADTGPPEGPKVDENVGGYYLESHDWKGALSRFESALVLDPENPDVYWGLAEAQRHLGDYANAKANYLKVMEYDPDSKHSKDAKKILKQPEIANAPAVSSNAATRATQPQP